MPVLPGSPKVKQCSGVLSGTILEPSIKALQSMCHAGSHQHAYLSCKTPCFSRPKAQGPGSNIPPCPLQTVPSGPRAVMLFPHPFYLNLHHLTHRGKAFLSSSNVNAFSHHLLIREDNIHYFSPAGPVTASIGPRDEGVKCSNREIFFFLVILTKHPGGESVLELYCTA